IWGDFQIDRALHIVSRRPSGILNSCLVGYRLVRFKGIRRNTQGGNIQVRPFSNIESLFSGVRGGFRRLQLTLHYSRLFPVNIGLKGDDTKYGGAQQPFRPELGPVSAVSEVVTSDRQPRQNQNAIENKPEPRTRSPLFLVVGLLLVVAGFLCLWHGLNLHFGNTKTCVLIGICLYAMVMLVSWQEARGFQRYGESIRIKLPAAQ